MEIRSIDIIRRQVYKTGIKLKSSSNRYYHLFNGTLSDGFKGAWRFWERLILMASGLYNLIFDRDQQIYNSDFRHHYIHPEL